MARIPTVNPNQFSAHEQAIVDRFLGARGKFPHEGPYSTMLHIPEVALQVDTLRRFLRDEASLP